MTRKLPFLIVTTLALGIASAAWFAQSSALAHCGTCGVGEASGSHEHAEKAKEMADGEMAGLPAAPAFTLTDSNGNEHALSDFRGKYVVLEWINHQCPFVKKFYDVGKMQQWQEHYTDEGVVWLTICSSAPGKQGHHTGEEWNSLIEEKNMNPTAVLLDESGEVGQAYGASNTPHMYVINPDGKLIYQGAIDSIRSADPADIEEATNYVTSLLDASLVKKTQAYGCSVKY